MNFYNDAAGERMVFERAKAQLLAGLSPDVAKAAVLSQSVLRLEQPLTNTTTTYLFPVLNSQTNNNNAVRATEVRLTQQDAFYVAGMRVTLCQAASAASTAMVLSTWPNPNIFTTPSGLAASCETLYNGYMTLTVNQDVVIPQFPLMPFRRVPQTQLTAATNSPVDMFDNEGIVAIQPNPVLIGQKGNKVTITIPSNITVVPVNVFIVVELFGVLAQNVTVVS